MSSDVDVYFDKYEAIIVAGFASQALPDLTLIENFAQIIGNEFLSDFGARQAHT